MRSEGRAAAAARRPSCGDRTMIARALAWRARQTLLVIALALLVVVSGEAGRRSLRRDIVPDLADPQIGVVADWMGHPAPQVAAAVTDVLTRALQGVPGAKTVRGSSMAGMAYVTVVFDSLAASEAGRGALAEQVGRLRRALPPAARI